MRLNKRLLSAAIINLTFLSATSIFPVFAGATIDKEVLIAQNSLGGASTIRQVSRTVDPTKVRKLFSSTTQTTGGAITQSSFQGDGFTYRADFGNWNGDGIFTLNWSPINRNSRVFVSIGECDPAGGKFIGGAKYTLYNVAPNNGSVQFWANIGWSYPIRVCADYLIVNP